MNVYAFAAATIAYALYSTYRWRSVLREATWLRRLTPSLRNEVLKDPFRSNEQARQAYFVANAAVAREIVRYARRVVYPDDHVRCSMALRLEHQLTRFARRHHLRAHRVLQALRSAPKERRQEFRRFQAAFLYVTSMKRITRATPQRGALWAWRYRDSPTAAAEVMRWLRDHEDAFDHAHISDAVEQCLDAAVGSRRQG